MGAEMEWVTIVFMALLMFQLFSLSEIFINLTRSPSPSPSPAATYVSSEVAVS